MHQRKRDDRQKIILDWAKNTFGPETAENPNERIARFTEEAIELAQAAGVTKAQMVELIDYVYSRPTGDIKQEVGGVCISLLAFCENLGISAENCEIVEAGRVLNIDPSHFRKRQDAKFAAGVALKSAG